MVFNLILKLTTLSIYNACVDYLQSAAIDIIIWKIVRNFWLNFFNII